MTSQELQRLLATVTPSSSEGADFLLDLRELLLAQGHPGKCVRCFFGLLGDLKQPGALQPLRLWLEQHLEVSVTAGAQEIDSFPVRLERAGSLEEFCHRAIDTVRQDRGFREREISLRFRFRQAHAASR